MIKCESCGWENPLHAAFCTNCGSELDRAEMSISTDMSASDELSLDGSESNLIIEAAKESAKKQRTQTEAPDEPKGEGQLDEETPPSEAGEEAKAKPAIEDRATLQLNPPSEPNEASVDESAEVQTGLDAAVRSTESEGPQGETDGSESHLRGSDEGPVVEAEQALTDDDASSELDEAHAGSKQESELSQGTSNALLAADTVAAPTPEKTDQSIEHDDSASSGDGIAYVAFDDGIPDDDDVTDLSMQSLDVGVESLSMDDSLYLGELDSGMSEDDSATEEARDTAEAPVSVSPSSVKLRRCDDHSADELILELDERGVLLGRESEIATLSDPFVSPNHCQINLTNGQVEVTDLNSLNGTWIRITEVQDLVHGDCIRLGNQTFTVEHSECDTSSDELADDNTRPWSSDRTNTGWYLTASDRLCVPIPDSGIRIGRLTGTLVFEQDAALSSVHAVMLPTGHCTKLRDFHTRTGSWLRLDGAITLDVGAEFMLGNTRFRIE